jgi:hypothetical protein
LLREQRERAELELKRTSDAAMRRLDDAQLEATLRAELLKAAHTYTPEEWAMLDRVRAEQSQGRAWGAAGDEQSRRDERH